MALAEKKPIYCILQFRASPFQQHPRSFPFTCPHPSKYRVQTYTQMDPFCSLQLDILSGTVSVPACQSTRCDQSIQLLKNKCHSFWSFLPCKYFRKAAAAGIRLQLHLFEWLLPCAGTKAESWCEPSCHQRLPALPWLGGPRTLPVPEDKD